MRLHNLLTRFTLFASVLVAFVQADIAQLQTLDIPECMQQCDQFASQATQCFRESERGHLSCDCRAAFFEPAVQDCFSRSCKPTETFSTIKAVADTCNEPKRDNSITYRTVLIVFFTFSTLTIIARYTTHFAVGRTTYLEDINMAAGYVLNTILFACCMRMSYTGLGKDMWNIPEDNITTTLLFFWISEYIYFATIGLVKTSFLIFYLQIFPLKQFRTVVWTCIVLNLTETLACSIAAIFVCSPISFAWTQWDGEHKGHCVSNNNLAFAHAGIGIVMDFVTLALPITQIWNLHMSTKKKLGVLLMFSVGAFVTVVSILRLRSLVHFAKTQNMSRVYLEASLWSVLEVQVGIICACLPSIRLGLARLFPKTMGSSVGNSKPSKQNNSHGNTLGTNWSVNGIGVTTSVRVSHAKRPQTNDQASFVQLVEIDADQKSSKSANSNDAR